MIKRQPYGYEIPIKVDMTGNRIERGILTPHAEEAPIVQKIFELRAEGLKVSSICNRLVEEGIRTRHGNLIWNQNTVSGILKRSDLYIKGYNESNGEAIWDPIVFLEETEALALGLIGADLSWLSPDVAEDLAHGLEEE